MTSWKANVFLHLSSANEANLKGIGKKWFVFIFPEVNYFYSCGTLPFISFILTAFHSSGTRASVCVTWVLINQPWCSIHHSKEWQQPVELLCKTPCAESKLWHCTDSVRLSAHPQSQGWESMTLVGPLQLRIFYSPFLQWEMVVHLSQIPRDSGGTACKGVSKIWCELRQHCKKEYSLLRLKSSGDFPCCDPMISSQGLDLQPKSRVEGNPPFLWV